MKTGIKHLREAAQAAKGVLSEQPFGFGAHYTALLTVITGLLNYTDPDVEKPIERPPERPTEAPKARRVVWSAGYHVAGCNGTLRASPPVFGTGTDGYWVCKCGGHIERET